MTPDAERLAERLAAADERRAALRYVTEAFAEAIHDGIEGDSLAHAALFTAFQEMVAQYGEEEAAKFAEGLPARIRAGEYTIALRH